jgi:hypothetical protein
MATIELSCARETVDVCERVAPFEGFSKVLESERTQLIGLLGTRLFFCEISCHIGLVQTQQWNPCDFPEHLIPVLSARFPGRCLQRIRQLPIWGNFHKIARAVFCVAVAEAIDSDVYPFDLIFELVSQIARFAQGFEKDFDQAVASSILRFIEALYEIPEGGAGDLLVSFL